MFGNTQKFYHVADGCKYYMTDEELMAFCQKWLDTPDLQRNPTSKAITYIANICLHWRIKKFITKNQRFYVELNLSKHTWRDQ